MNIHSWEFGIVIASYNHERSYENLLTRNKLIHTFYCTSVSVHKTECLGGKGIQYLPTGTYTIDDDDLVNEDRGDCENVDNNVV